MARLFYFLLEELVGVLDLHLIFALEDFAGTVRKTGFQFFVLNR